MRVIFNTAAFLILLFFTNITYGQSNKELALQKAKEAIKLEDEEGKFDEAIKLLEEAEKLDPENITYPYERAYAYSGKKEYKQATEILEKLLRHKDINPRVYQALGNGYDYQGKAEKAIDTYEKGLKKFPNAGELYLEIGNMKLMKEDYAGALPYYEKGIENDPAFPSNYYWASKIYCNSDEKVWGMLYGEIFMNLERNSRRTPEISKLLFDTYKKGITIKSDTSFGVSFSKTATISLSDLQDPKKFKLPFAMGTYELLLSVAAVGVKAIDLTSLDRIRTNFIDGYFKGEHAQNYPNVLFDYQKAIRTAGHFEAYNHWLLMKGDEDAFTQWQQENKGKWDSFVEWYTDNRLELDPAHKFYRKQY